MGRIMARRKIMFGSEIKSDLILRACGGTCSPGGPALALISRSPIGRYLSLPSDWLDCGTAAALLSHILRPAITCSCCSRPVSRECLPAPAVCAPDALSLLRPRSRQTSAIAAADKISSENLNFEEKTVRERDNGT